MELSAERIGSGKPLVLLHAFPLNHRMFKIEELPGYQVILPDFPGFDSKGSVDSNLNMEIAADALNKYLTAFLTTHQKIILGGISMGGYLAFEFLRKFPEKVSKLILISTKANLDSPETQKRRIEMANQVEIDGVGYLPRVMLPGLLGNSTLTNKPQIVEEVKKMILMANPTAIAAAQRAMAVRRDQTKLLSEINIPTMVIAGREDKLIPVKEAEFMAQTIPNCELKVIEDVGHLVPIENPDFFLKILSDFIN